MRRLDHYLQVKNIAKKKTRFYTRNGSLSLGPSLLRVVVAVRGIMLTTAPGWIRALYLEIYSLQFLKSHKQGYGAILDTCVLQHDIAIFYEIKRSEHRS